MNSFTDNSHLQDRINRMNAWKDQQTRTDEEFIRRQKIRMFINDCDEIRPTLRSQLLKDSKICQLEQIRDHQKQREMMTDDENAWKEIQQRDQQQQIEREKLLSVSRWRDNQEVQEFLKLQMADKVERGLKICEEINEERKQFAKTFMEEQENERERLRNEKVTRKTIGNAVTTQMHENYQTRKEKLERELKIDQMINDRIHNEMKRQQNKEKEERDQFRRDVFSYLDHLMVTRQHNENVECEKEKLIEDIRQKAAEDEWRLRCDAKKKRFLVNQTARLGQVEQIKLQEKQLINEAAKLKNENEAFNEREMFERQKIKESQWQQRLSAFRYGRELLEQRKTEEIRDLAEKQKLNESLMLAEQERKRCETMGKEFFKTYQDVLPLHPNLLIIQKGKKN